MKLRVRRLLAVTALVIVAAVSGVLFGFHLVRWNGGRLSFGLGATGIG